MSRGWPGDMALGFRRQYNLGSPVSDPPVLQPGTYDVTLTVARQDGARKTITVGDVLDTRQAAESQVVIDTIRTGSINKGSFLSFVSTDSNSSVTVNGARVPHRQDRW